MTMADRIVVLNAGNIEQYGSPPTDGQRRIKIGGSVPEGPGKWTGTNPILPMAGTWKPWVLASPGEFRPGPPVPYDSPEKSAELAELKNFPRTPLTNNEALRAQPALRKSPAGLGQRKWRGAHHRDRAPR
jgi:hypothetical protein